MQERKYHVVCEVELWAFDDQRVTGLVFFAAQEFFAKKLLHTLLR
jgi:hypothetical protein